MPLSVISWEFQVPRSTVSWDWDRCVAVTTLGSTAFLLVSLRLLLSTDGGTPRAPRDRRGRVWPVSRACAPIEGKSGY